MYEDVFRFKIPQNKPRIEKTMDILIADTEFEVNDPKFLRVFGIYVKPLKRHGLIGFYRDSDLGETIVRLKNNNVLKKNGFDGTVEYDFVLKPKKLNIPKLPIL